IREDGKIKVVMAAYRGRQGDNNPSIAQNWAIGPGSKPVDDSYTGKKVEIEKEVVVMDGEVNAVMVHRVGDKIVPRGTKIIRLPGKDSGDVTDGILILQYPDKKTTQNVASIAAGTAGGGMAVSGATAPTTVVEAKGKIEVYNLKTDPALEHPAVPKVA